MTDQEWADLSDWEKEEWCRAIQPIMDALMSVTPLTICAFAPEVLAEMGREMSA